AAGEAAAQAGLDAEAGAKGFTAFATALAEARAATPQEETRGIQVLRGLGRAADDAAKGITEMDAAAKQAAGDVRVLRGNAADATNQFDSMGRLLPSVMRGGARAMRDFSDEWKAIGIDAQRVKPEDIVKTYETAIKRVLGL